VAGKFLPGVLESTLKEIYDSLATEAPLFRLSSGSAVRE
jgi:hypothetical protein